MHEKKRDQIKIFFHNSHLIRLIQQNKIKKTIDSFGQGLNPSHLLDCQPL